MANATSDALTDDAASRSRGAAGSGQSNRRSVFAGSKRSNVRAQRLAIEELRRLLVSSRPLFAGSIDARAAGSVVLEFLEHVVPSRQSALLLAREGGDELIVGAARGDPMTISEATWIEQTARECLLRAKVLRRERLHSALSSFVWVPVLNLGQRIAVIELGDNRKNSLADSDLRELSLLADEVGRLLVGVHAREEREVRMRALEGELAANLRETQQLRRMLTAASGRDTVADLAIRIAERAVGPSISVLSNLQHAREGIASMQCFAGTLDDEKASEFQTSFDALEPMIDDVEDGARALRKVGLDLRELSLGDSAPIDWVDVSQIIDQALDVVSRRAPRHFDIELRIEDLPPIRCQRLRLVTLLVSLLDHVSEFAATRAAESGAGCAARDASIGISAERRGANTIVEISVECDLLPLDGDDPIALGIASESQRLQREIVEDLGGQLDFQVTRDLAVATLALPTDRD